MSAQKPVPVESGLLAMLSGRPVCVHASMRSFDRAGADRVSADRVIDALLAVSATILVPTFTYHAEQPAPLQDRPDRNATDYAPTPAHAYRFDPARNDLSRQDMGAFPATLLARPERRRGWHPLNSFAALGPEAERLVSGQTPSDVYAPLRALCAANGAVLMIGTGPTSMTLLHLAEADAGRTLFRRWARDRDGTVIGCAVGSCSAGFDAFEAVIEADEDIVAGSRWRCFDATATRAAAAAAIRARPDITDCGRPGCERCRDAIAGGPLLHEQGG